jgi:hypothetical protein
MKTQDSNDEFIRKLVRQKGTDKAPDQFTEMVMGKIQSRPATDNSPLLSTGTWIALIAGLAAMIVVIFTVDIPFFDTMFSSSNIEKVSMNIFSRGFFETMALFFKSLKISSITWMIIAAALGLVVLERLLRKRFPETRILMIW